MMIYFCKKIGLKDVGNCVYELIRPVLFACSVDQLVEIEDLSPHLMLGSDEIWSLHLKRDYPNESTNLNSSIQSNSSYPTKTINPYTNEEISLPLNRVKYFKIKESKERALANASARLRERTQANRSEFGKRKAIFTGETDRAQSIHARHKRSNLNHRPYQSKSLAEKARQQVKKSCAVYANASRLKSSIISQPFNSSNSSLTTSIGTPSSSTSTHQSTSSSHQPAPRSHLQNPNIVVKVIPSKPTPPSEPSSRIIKPTPFQSTSKAPLIKVVRPIIPIPRSSSNPISTQLNLPITNTSSHLHSSKSISPSTLNSNSNPNPTSSSSNSNPNPNPTSSKKPSSLFMPKTKKPPPPTPLRSIISIPLNSTSSSTRMSRPPPVPSSSKPNHKRSLQ
ncbi:RNA polymerase II transcription factor SIII subunit A-domain-containing protein [Melampsora americana]|nr:RNA polymerase II transcription factor SIII subunit A-domain-containing protein [Melampsora americana]